MAKSMVSKEKKRTIDFFTKEIEMKKMQVVCVALIALGLVFVGAEPVEAQKKGQSASIQHGVVVKSERVDLSDDKTTKGAKVGGTVGLISGGSSGYKRRRNAAIGAASGAVIGSATSTQQMGMMYTVDPARQPRGLRPGGRRGCRRSGGRVPGGGRGVLGGQEGARRRQDRRRSRPCADEGGHPLQQLILRFTKGTTMREKIVLSVVTVLLLVGGASAADVVHDAEYYILNAQNGERWAAEDRELDKKLAELRAKYGQPPNIVYVLWDDTAFGSVGFPALQKNFGYETPNLNRMADEGINFTRMYTEPSCTPTRAAVLTGRHPVRHGMGVVGMPHEFSGKGHLGDIEESYLHNQGFDEALFTPMNQITSLYSPMGNAANAVLGLHPEIYPPDPYQLDKPGLVPEGWVQSIEGKKGEQGKEWCGTSNECFEKVDTECEARIIDFIQRNAKAGNPFHALHRQIDG
jgi:hypothetical protein